VILARHYVGVVCGTKGIICIIKHLYIISSGRVNKKW
jgi:hypothetical protein